MIDMVSVGKMLIINLPTTRSSASEARGRILFQMSMVKSVVELLNIDVSVLTTAAIMAATSKPRIP